MDSSDRLEAMGIFVLNHFYMLVEIPGENQIINLQYIESIAGSTGPDNIGRNNLYVQMASGDQIVLNGWNVEKWNKFMQRVMTQMSITQGGRMS